MLLTNFFSNSICLSNTSSLLEFNVCRPSKDWNSFIIINFIGKTAALSVKSTGPQRLLCTFVVEAKDADAWADEPIWYNGDVVGFLTSGGYAHFAQKSVAMGFVPTPLVCPKLNVEIEIVGERCPASLIAKPLFDRESKRLRG